MQSRGSEIGKVRRYITRGGGEPSRGGRDMREGGRATGTGGRNNKGGGDKFVKKENMYLQKR